MNQPGPLVHWSDDPYSRFPEKSLEDLWRPRSHGGQELLPFSSGRHQPHLDGLDRGLSAIRYPKLGEDALQMPLNRREGEVQLLGYLAVRLARGDVAEDFRLPRCERVGHRRR